jgi:hypothetical protein
MNGARTLPTSRLLRKQSKPFIGAIDWDVGAYTRFAMPTHGWFHCPNPGCGFVIEVVEPSHNPHFAAPVCGCGTRMKKAYEKPAVRMVDDPSGTKKKSAGG